jgi:hypothetical protein
MSLFYDLKLKRQKAGSTSGGPTVDIGYGGGGATSASSDSEEHDGDYSPASSPTHDGGHHHGDGRDDELLQSQRRFSNSSSRETGSPSDINISPTRSSDGDSLLSSPIGNSKAAAMMRHNRLYYKVTISN